ncbi:Galanin receptor type 3 [Folsomia candida]|uniref:Galanin receptor type 3 n=1 Tax=Folsomia candida TaxID=158441 RepID=A0A226EYK3_FOLCA|nr:Galanin receptor type 3 [Folsomia candida]
MIYRFADFCVGVFCVYQNIISYMMESWIFGSFMCKMYHFISSLSTTASILILVVICIERYLAIIHPMRCKQMLTLNRLRLTIVAVWVISGLISSPRFYYFNTVSMPYPDGKVEVLCVPNRLMYDSKLVDMVSMTLLFLLPLMVISILYFRIGVALWKSSNANMPSASTSAESSSSSCRCDSTAGINANSSTPSPASYGRGERKRSIVQQLNHCLPCVKGPSRKRHRRSSGSFYGSDRAGYAGYTGVNLTTINGLGGGAGGNIPANQQVNPRNLNGLVISCNGGSSLTPIIKSTSQTQNTSSTTPQSPSNILHNHHHTNQVPHAQACCSSCASVISSRGGGGTESVPVSPYLKRDSTPLSSPPPPPTSINTEPLVLVKFEKKSSLRKCRRNQCTILMRSTMSASTPPSSDDITGGCKNCSNGRMSNSSVTISGAIHEHGGSNSCSYGGPTKPTATMVSSCQICEKCEAAALSANGRAQQDLFTKLDGCDKNVDSHLVSKDSIQGPHQSLIHFGTCHHCGVSCQTNPPIMSCGAPDIQCSSLKGLHSSNPATTKGPKRMRVVRSSKYGTRALQCRRRIIKMLIVIVVAFALCHFPIHFRKCWQYWGKGYEAGSVFSSLFTPITFLIMYAQSGINCLLYSFMSRKFRNSFADLLCCNMRRSLKISRNLSVRSTNAIQLSQAA